MQVARCRTEAVSGQPQIDITWFDLANLGEPPGRPIRFDSADYERFSLHCFWFLVLNGFQIAVAQLSQGELSLRAIDLGSLLFFSSKIALCQFAICGFETAPNFFAARLEPRIISAVPVTVRPCTNLLKGAGFFLWCSHVVSTLQWIKTVCKANFSEYVGGRFS